MADHQPADDPPRLIPVVIHREPRPPGDHQSDDDPARLTPVVISRAPRPLAAFDALDAISHFMDRCFELPGSRMRFGFNSVMLLFLPGLGDLITGLVSLMILSVAITHCRVPRIVAARMMLNSLLDVTVSAVPVVGSLWGAWFKANTRNVNLLRPYATMDAGEKPPSTLWHWVVVVLMLLLGLAVLALLVAAMVWLVAAALRALQTPEAA